MTTKPNVLFITVDQFRADCLFGALGEHVNLPNMRALADDGVAFHQHFSVTSPCGPSRVSLLTGQYAMNHRSVRNGTPMRADTPTLGTEARKAGYEPLLFGYTDTSVDPRGLPPDDPRLFTYEEVAPGFTEAVRMRLESDVSEWRDHLATRGIDLPSHPQSYAPKGDTPDAPAIYDAEDSDTAFLARRFIEEISTKPPGWFAHLTFLRPHPPFVAPEPFNRMYPPETLPNAIPAGNDAHPFLAPARAHAPIWGTVVGFRDLADSPENTRLLRSLYLGLATEVDVHLGRIFDALKAADTYDDTIIVFTSDHGEMLGDFGQWGKASYHDAAFHVPLIVKLPGGAAGQVVEAFTESIDVTPTILDLIGVDVPHSMDGQSLRPFLTGDSPEDWRDVSLSELDFGDPILPTMWQKQLGLPPEAANLAVLRHGDMRLVQFASDLPARLYDMSAGGETEDLAANPDVLPILLDLSRRMLCHRMQHAEGTFSRTMITSGGPVTVNKAPSGGRFHGSATAPDVTNLT